MKKATLLACACAMFIGAQSLVAQEANEITYVSDPSQGYLLNRTRDNWFITAEGGANISFAKYGIHTELKDRFAPTAGLYVGKWFSPVFGGRFGASWYTLKGCSPTPTNGALLDHVRPDGYYKTKTQEIGAMFDLMVNLTNWWCGYRPGRVYNASFYVGGGAYFTFAPDYVKGSQDGWKYAHNCRLTTRAGILNTFNVSKQVAINLDLRWTLFGAPTNENNASALLGLTYKFKNREWNAPVVPVCPEPENCDAYRERLAAADARIASLEDQLRRALNRPVETVECPAAGPIATVYYPIGVSTLSRENQRVVTAIASVMNSEEYSNKSFVITGWADNYTGTDNINARLRTRRAETVKNLLVRKGVAADRLEVNTDAANRMGEGRDYIALDRAVTITEK